MATFDCGHPAAGAPGHVCQHLLGTKDPSYIQHFTGRGLTFVLVCPACRNDPAGPDVLRTVCAACFKQTQTEGSWDGTGGQPEVRERPTGLWFEHEVIRPAWPHEDLLDIRPLNGDDRNGWVAVTRTGDVVQLHLDHQTRLSLVDSPVRWLCNLPPSSLDLAGPVSLHLDRSGRVAAVVNTRGRHGVVVDLETGRATMRLERDDYHTQHCTFPAAFVEWDGRLLLIHGTAWNRLDVSDARTGELLTPRGPTSYSRGEARPEHYLDYFHCGLTVSPGQEYVVDNGWVWSPFGAVEAWSVRRWLTENVWESEDGPSKKVLCGRSYYWDGPLCWIGDHRLAVWGYGEDDEWLIPAVRLFDVRSGDEERWFAGPKGALVFDDYLFALDMNEGTTVWDVATGDRLLRDGTFRPLRSHYHPGARVFLTRTPEGAFQVSRLRGRPVGRDVRAWAGGTVVRLAQGIAQDRAFDRLPVLADALEEAGCTDADVLAHCRQAGPHGRRCWAVDRVLDEG